MDAFTSHSGMCVRLSRVQSRAVPHAAEVPAPGETHPTHHWNSRNCEPELELGFRVFPKRGL